MTTALATQPNYPTDPKTGLTLPLSKSLGSQDLAKHKALVAVELEVMAKKMDRFGWERDRDTMAHDRIVIDWMDGLQDFPLDEVQAACRQWVQDSPRKMPNEGDIRGKIMSARSRKVAALPRHVVGEVVEPRVSKDRAAQILAEAGFAVKRAPGCEVEAAE